MKKEDEIRLVLTRHLYSQGVTSKKGIIPLRNATCAKERPQPHCFLLQTLAPIEFGE